MNTCKKNNYEQKLFIFCQLKWQVQKLTIRQTQNIENLFLVGNYSDTVSYSNTISNVKVYYLKITTKRYIKNFTIVKHLSRKSNEYLKKKCKFDFYILQNIEQIEQQ